ncbi:MAG: hypothetical protein GF332_04155 [Candidatus Moranbacteria bacterium]|nr:hypothetical protein [Candidatus Moranbacteria bacterium]
MSYRQKSANINLRDELASIINQELDMQEMFLTVTQAQISKDLKYLNVNISVMPEEKLPKALQILTKNVSLLAQKLAQKVKIKHIPRIKFLSDQGHDNMLQVQEILKKLKNES